MSVRVLTEHVTHGFSDAVSVDMARNPGNSIRQEKEEEKEEEGEGEGGRIGGIETDRDIRTCMYMHTFICQCISRHAHGTLTET